MNENFKKEVKLLSPFTKFIWTIGELPSSYLLSMTYEEQLIWLCNYLEKTVIPTVNNNGEAIVELQDLFVQLKSYVDNYFDNLDVQEEINNKLDEMAESGDLATIITAYLQVKSVLAYDTKDDLKAADNLFEGSTAKTLGDSSYQDGKGYFYKIRELEEGEVIDDDLLVGLTNYPELVAEKIPIPSNSYDALDSLINDQLITAGNTVTVAGYYTACDGGDANYYIRQKGVSEVANNITTYETDNGLIAEICDNTKALYAKKYGVKCDSVSDDTARLQALINYAYSHNKGIVLDGYAYVSTTIDTKGVEISGIGEQIHLRYYYISKTYGNIGYDYLNNVGNGALITFSDYVDDNLSTGSGIISDTANPIVAVHYPDRFHLKNLTICGWLRNTSQVGVKNLYDNTNPPTYIYGAQRLDNVSVINCGSHGIELTNLEMTTLRKVYSMLNFGCGLYINGSPSINTPTEYVKFEYCRFCGDRNGGVYINKGYNKCVKFENCEFTASGLYNQLGTTIPSDRANIVAGLTINDYKGYQYNLMVNDCYAEQLNELIKINTPSGSHIFNDICITNNTMYGIDSNACLLYLNTYYSQYFVFHNNFISQGDQFVNGFTNANLIVHDVDQRVYNNLNTSLVSDVTYHSSLNVSKSIFQRFGNLIYVCIEATATASIPVSTDIIQNFPKPLDNIPMTCVINETYHTHTWWVNRKASTPAPLSNGDFIRIMGCYFVSPESNKNGTY